MSLKNRIILMGVSFMLFFTQSTKAMEDSMYVKASDLEEGVGYLVNFREKIWSLVDQQQFIEEATVNKVIMINSKKFIDDTLDFLYPSEKTLLYFWSGQYGKIKSDILSGKDFHNEKQSIKTVKDRRYKLLLYYGKDSLLETILHNSLLKASDIKNAINQSASLNEDEKKLLILYLKTILASNSPEKASPESFLEESDDFLNTYPNSPYSPYVRNSLNLRYNYGKWGFGGGFYTGFSMFGGDLSNYFSNGVPIGISLDVSYKKMYFLFNFSGTATKVKKSFVYDGDWSRNLIATGTYGNLGFGYSVINNEKSMLIPYIGISGLSFSAVKDEDNVSTANDLLYNEGGINLNIGNLPSYTIGVAYDLKFKFFKSYGSYKDIFLSKLNKNYGFLRFRVGYNNPLLEEKSNIMPGHHFFINVGVGTWVNNADKI